MALFDNQDISGNGPFSGINKVKN